MQWPSAQLLLQAWASMRRAALCPQPLPSNPPPPFLSQAPIRMLDLGCGDSDYVARIIRASPQLQAGITSYTGARAGGAARTARPLGCRQGRAERSQAVWSQALPPQLHPPPPTNIHTPCGPLGCCTPAAGVDMSAPAMAISATNMADACSPSCSIDHHEGDMIAYVTDAAAAGRTYDLVLASFSLHHLSTAAKEQMVAALGRVVAPGGVFLLCDIFKAPGEQQAGLSGAAGQRHTVMQQGGLAAPLGAALPASVARRSRAALLTPRGCTRVQARAASSTWRATGRTWSSGRARTSRVRGSSWLPGGWGHGGGWLLAAAHPHLLPTTCFAVLPLGCRPGLHLGPRQRVRLP